MLTQRWNVPQQCCANRSLTLAVGNPLQWPKNRGHDDDPQSCSGLFGPGPGPRATKARPLEIVHGRHLGKGMTDWVAKCLGWQTKAPTPSPAAAPCPSNGARAAADPSTPPARASIHHGCAAFTIAGGPLSCRAETMGTGELESNHGRPVGSSTVDGYRISFHTSPHQAREPRPFQFLEAEKVAPDEHWTSS